MKKIFKITKILVMIFLLNTITLSKTIIVGTNAEFAPFEYLDENKIVGFDIELVQEIGKRLNRPIKIENLSFDGLIPALQVGKVDLLIAGMTKTPERSKFVGFTNDYFVAKQVLIVRKDAVEPKKVEELKGQKVGVILGFTGDLIITKIPEIKSEKYNTIFSAIMALNTGKVDSIIVDSAPAKSYVAENKNLKIVEIESAEEKYAIAGKKNSPLLKEINVILAEMLKDGTYDKIVKKYFK